MSEPIPFTSYEVPGIGTVTAHEGVTYVVATPGGAVHGYRSPSGEPSEANAAADIAHAIANPPSFPLPVPAEVSPLQMRRALNAAGLRPAVEAAVAAASQDMRDAWDYASVVKRDDPLLAAMAAALGQTSEQVDALFRLAATFS